MAYDPNFVYERTYRGKVKALVLDWSGTVADAYVLAPAVVFTEVFKKHGVEISMFEARGPVAASLSVFTPAIRRRPAFRSAPPSPG